MMKNKTKIILLLLLLLMMIGCCWYHFVDKRPQRSCPIESLILDVEMLPEGTFAEELYSPAIDETDESASRSFVYKYDLIYHDVIRKGSKKVAGYRFNHWIKVAFDEDQDSGLWGPYTHTGLWLRPKEIEYVSPIADNYQFACGKVGDKYQCRLVATYEEYFVLFAAYVSPQGITLEKVEEMLIAMDQRMAECLQE